MSAESLFPLVPWVVFIPLIGILVNFLFGKALGEKGVGAVASLAAFGSFVVSVLLALGLTIEPEGARIFLARWMQIGDFVADWSFQVDTLSVTMMLVVSGVGTLIHIYSIGYMHSDVRFQGHPERFRRFFLFLNLFIAAMMILVSADNYLTLFVGWEGVGLCSFLLIGFWFEKGAEGTGNAKAAKKAFVVNRIGDLGLLIAMFLMFWTFRTFNFNEIATLTLGGGGLQLLLINLFLLLAVTGKSAQLPLYVWLPDAMAGPTPVSALIHAATMVTAGVYLVARSQPLYAPDPLSQSIVVAVGALTALFAATIALGQFDIKKVLAYSTISQLGFMVAAVGMGATVAGMFHLVTHAFFKALLFLGSGAVILGLEHAHLGHAPANGKHKGEHGKHEDSAHGGHDFDPQDMRNMGGLRTRMPVTFWVYLVGALALAGIAPFAGFFSKDEILAAAREAFPLAFYALLLAAFFTAFYMGRQLILVFFGKPRTDAAAGAKDPGGLVLGPLVVLAILSVLGGALNMPGVYTLEHWLEHSVLISVHGEFELLLAGIALLVAVVGLALAWLIYSRRPVVKTSDPDPLQTSLGPAFRGMNRKWWVDELYGALFVRPYRWLADQLAGIVDQGLIDGLVNGFGLMTRALAGAGRSLQNGFVRSYALIFLSGVVAIFAYLLLR
jgi:NADH-quinone oxidoreductase subunit L